MFNYEEEHDILAYKGIRNIEKLSFYDSFVRNRDVVMQMIYYMEVATMQQLCFMLNLNYEQVSNAIVDINRKAKSLEKSGKKFEHLIRVEKVKEHYYGRNRCFYYLTSNGIRHIESENCESRKSTNFLKLIFHFNESGFLYSRLFKNSFKIDIEREVPFVDKKEKVIVRSDSMITYYFDRTHYHNLYVEYDNNNERGDSFAKKISRYAKVMLYNKGLILVVTMGKGKGFNLKYESTKDAQLININSKLSKFKKLKKHAEQISILALDFNNNVRVVMEMFEILIASDYKYKSFDDNKISSFKDRENDYFEFKKIYDEDPDNLSSVHKINNYILRMQSLKFYQNEKHSIHEGSIKFWRIARNRIENIFNLSDTEEIPASELLELPMSNYSEYTLNYDKYVIPTFKKSLLVNDVFFDTQYDIGDFFELLFSSMKDIKYFFKYIFCPKEDMKLFKYEPVHYSVNDELNSKSIFSATCTIKDKKVGMIIYSPTVCISDVMKLKLLEDNMFRSEFDYDEIRYIILKDEDIFGVVRNKKTSAIRDYTDIYVNTYSEKDVVDTEAVDFSWLGDNINNRVETM